MDQIDLSLKVAVEHADKLTYKDFKKKYLFPGKPVLIKGLANMQPAGEKWTIDWFKKTMGDLQIGVFDNNVKKHLYSTTVNPDMKMDFGDFLDLITKDEPSTIRMFRYNLYKQNPVLRKDFSCPSFIRKLNPMRRFGFMFLGGKDTDVRLHYDVDYSNVLLTQFYGRKKVILFPPEYSKFLYQMPYNTHSLVDVKNADFDSFPGLKHVKGYEITQEAGDGVFMPSGHWHYNTYLTGGISVAFRKLAVNPRGLLKGVKFMTLTMPFDKTMNFLIGKNWFKKKEKMCVERVTKSISQIN